MFYTAKLSLTHHMAIPSHQIKFTLTHLPRKVTPCIITYNIKQTQLKNTLSFELVYTDIIYFTTKRISAI